MNGLLELFTIMEPLCLCKMEFCGDKNLLDGTAICKPLSLPCATAPGLRVYCNVEARDGDL